MLTDLVATETVLKKARCPDEVSGQLGGDDPAWAAYESACVVLTAERESM